MLLWVLLFASWPFHSKKVVPVPKMTIEQQDEFLASGRCEKVNDLWFFLGKDDMIGMSTVSCGHAYRKWIETHIVPIKTGRV